MAAAAVPLCEDLFPRLTSAAEKVVRKVAVCLNEWTLYLHVQSSSPPILQGSSRLMPGRKFGTPAHPHTRTPAHPHTRTPAHPHTSLAEASGFAARFVRFCNIYLWRLSSPSQCSLSSCVGNANAAPAPIPVGGCTRRRVAVFFPWAAAPLAALLVLAPAPAAARFCGKEDYYSGNLADCTLLYISDSGLTSLNLSGLSNLWNLEISDNNSLRSLDLSGLNNLSTIGISDNKNLTSLVLPDPDLPSLLNHYHPPDITVFWNDNLRSVRGMSALCKDSPDLFSHTTDSRIWIEDNHPSLPDYEGYFSSYKSSTRESLGNWVFTAARESD